MIADMREGKMEEAESKTRSERRKQVYSGAQSLLYVGVDIRALSRYMYSGLYCYSGLTSRYSGPRVPARSRSYGVQIQVRSERRCTYVTVKSYIASGFPPLVWFSGLYPP